MSKHIQEPSADPMPAAQSFNIPTSTDDVLALLSSWGEQITLWAQSPAFLAQVGAIIAAILLAPVISTIVKARLPLFKSMPPENARFFDFRNSVYKTRAILRPIMLVILLAIFAAALKALPTFGEEGFVRLAQGLAAIFAIFKATGHFVSDPQRRKLINWTLLPVALLIVFGYFGKLLDYLESIQIVPSMGIHALTLVKLIVFGGLFFWLGGISNTKGQTAIRNQTSLDVSTREIVAKIFQIILFGLLFILVLSVAGVPFSGLVIIFSTLTLGIGLGLQPVAANFVSGLIILFDRSVQVGDYVELPDGQQGYVEAINMRSTTVETTDGKDVMVPNTKFLEESYLNWTHKDPRQRFEVYFSVAYDTDIDRLENILIPAVSEHPQVLQEPETPDLELREFGDHGIKFAIEFWADGIDDGPNKFTSDLNFIVWRTLKTHGIQMPLPQLEIRNLK